MRTNILFVYGTLRSGFDNRYAKLLHANSEFLGPATVMGSLFQIGDYLGYRPEPRGEVPGELYRLNDPDELFPILDDYEGPDYQRVMLDGIGWIYQCRF
jgi:gamma-glutamylcyclotransferase (GGCT)/AIG2-like uncharacterized protein YtfP